MEANTANQYPNIIQSVGITAITILLQLLLAPMLIFLTDLVNKELATLIYYTSTIGISFWIFHALKKNKTSIGTYNLDLHNPRIIPIIIIATIVLLFGVISPIVSLIPIPEFLRQVWEDTANQTGIFTFITMVIAAPILEELLFRGIILDGLLKKYSPTTAILLSSILFGIAHLNPWQFVMALLIGVFSGWIYSETRSLLPSIIIHTTGNFAAFILRFILSDSNVSINASWTESYGSPLNVIVLITTALGVLIFCIYLLKNEFLKNKLNTYLENF
jgi:membrane protease YdiL (CAAX protease family)